MKFLSILILSILILLFLQGCGTIINRTSGPMQAKQHTIYGGVKTDLDIVSNKDDLGFIAALDVPLSIIADTILLPIDLIISWSRYGDNINK